MPTRNARIEYLQGSPLVTFFYPYVFIFFLVVSAVSAGARVLSAGFWLVSGDVELPNNPCLA